MTPSESFEYVRVDQPLGPKSTDIAGHLVSEGINAKSIRPQPTPEGTRFVIEVSKSQSDKVRAAMQNFTMKQAS